MGNWFEVIRFFLFFASVGGFFWWLGRIEWRLHQEQRADLKDARDKLERCNLEWSERLRLTSTNFANVLQVHSEQTNEALRAVTSSNQETARQLANLARDNRQVLYKVDSDAQAKE